MMAVCIIGWCSRLCAAFVVTFSPRKTYRVNLWIKNL